MRTILVCGLAALVGGCAGPMLTSVDLTRARGEGVVATYGVGVSVIELKALPYGGAEGVSQACATALDAYDVSRGLYRDAKRVYEMTGLRVALIRTRLDPRSRDEEGPTAVAAALSDADKTAILADVEAFASAALALTSQAVKTEDNIEPIRAHCPTETLTLSVGLEVKPSDSRLFGVDLRSGWMSDDSVTVTTGADSLPASITGDADDKTAVAAVSVASLIGRLAVPMPYSDLKGFREYALASPPPPSPAPDRSADPCALHLLRPERQLDALKARPECFTSGAIMGAISAFTVWPKEFLNLRPGPPPPPLRYSLAELEGATYAGADLTVTCAQVQPQLEDESASEFDGIVVATPIPCRLSVSVDNREIQRVSFIGLSADHLMVLPVERAALVRNKTELTLQNGVVTTVSLSRPSRGAAILALPGTIIGGVFTGISEAIAGNGTVETARTAYLEAETRRANAETANLQAWSADDSAYFEKMGDAAMKQSAYDALAEEDPGRLQARIDLRNAQAQANQAAAQARRPLPFPDLT